MREAAKELIKQGDKLFEKKQPLLSLWQDIADNFYPQRGDFTVSRTLGNEFCSHLMTSYPLIIQRSLANLMQQILQPIGSPWQTLRLRYGHDELGQEAKIRLEKWSGIMRKAMYDPEAQYVRSTKELFPDCTAFGQGVLEIDFSLKTQTMIYRTEHLRDFAWMENENRIIDTIYMKRKFTARALASLVGSAKVSQKVREALEKDPYQEFECMRCVMPSEYYAGEKKFKQPWTVVFMERETCHILDEAGSITKKYVIPRMATVSGSQYGHSPCALIGLPAARALQTMMLTIIEAGEKAVDPPMLYNSRIIKTDLSLFAGGATRADLDEGQRLSDAMMPVVGDHQGLRQGLELFQQVQREIMESFYLDKLSLPPDDGVERTAFELAKRLQQTARDASPIFEPVMTEINAPICNDTFDILMSQGVFGRVEDFPEELIGQEVDFVFESPLLSIQEESKMQQLVSVIQATQAVAAIDPSTVNDMNWRTAFRDSLGGSGIPEAWIREQGEADEITAQQQEDQAEQAAIQQAQDVAVTANVAGQAEHSLKTAAAA